ncbi:hypothetical protein [Bradyrhizobium sp. SZCCHNRI3043]|uniref:hypothetical protein n=1 Tax=Bradyrhizobium sp. SZCCHNRI3043 TaxID=3057292 RepID=UPI0028E9159D|nr:hypothetical protein [Bradyrhizobium sp. SZCCHNRI3043]
MASDTLFQASCQHADLDLSGKFNPLAFHNNPSEAAGRIQNLRFAHFVCGAHKISMERLFREHQGTKRALSGSCSRETPAQSLEITDFLGGVKFGTRIASGSASQR